jgi:hypothetical protein
MHLLSHISSDNIIIHIATIYCTKKLPSATQSSNIPRSALCATLDTYNFINRYKDIGELMQRCETLVATRDNLRFSLKMIMYCPG